jgi:hypothetical protein
VREAGHDSKRSQPGFGAGLPNLLRGRALEEVEARFVLRDEDRPDVPNPLNPIGGSPATGLEVVEGSRPPSFVSLEEVRRRAAAVGRHSVTGGPSRR